MAIHQQPVAPALKHEGVAGLIKPGQAPQWDPDRHPLALAWLEAQSVEAHKCASWTLHGPAGGLGVDLNHLRGAHRPGVRHRHAELQGPFLP